MGGKRPDQYNIDPAEGSSTDKKWGQGHEDEGIKEEEKDKLQSNPHDQPMIPTSGVNPALRELRERKHAKTPPEENSEDEIDRLSEDSFPASDPPPGPTALGGKGASTSSSKRS